MSKMQNKKLQMNKMAQTKSRYCLTTWSGVYSDDMQIKMISLLCKWQNKLFAWFFFHYKQKIIFLTLKQNVLPNYNNKITSITNLKFDNTIKFHQEKSFHIFFIYIHIFCQFELFLIFIKIKTSNSNEILTFKLQSPTDKSCPGFTSTLHNLPDDCGLIFTALIGHLLVQLFLHQVIKRE